MKENYTRSCENHHGNNVNNKGCIEGLDENIKSWITSTDTVYWGQYKQQWSYEWNFG